MDKVEQMLSAYGASGLRKGSRAVGHSGPENGQWEDYVEVPVSALENIAAALREQPEARGVVDCNDGHADSCICLQPGDRECNCHKAYGFATADEMETADCEHDYRETADDRLPGSWIDVCRKCGHEKGTALTAAQQPIRDSNGWKGGECCADAGTYACKCNKYAPPSALVGVEVSGYIATVPDNCDRIIWRGRYHHLPLAQQPAQAAPGGGVSLIAAERNRQIEAEGWTTEHDDEHASGSLALAAGCYALASFLDSDRSLKRIFDTYWPWEREWWKPRGGVADLVRAGALIAAEIDRLQRATPPGDDAAGGG